MTAMFSNILDSGGWILVCIGLASLVGLTVVIERCWRLVPLRARFQQRLRDCEHELVRRGPAALRESLADAEDGMGRMLWRALGAAGRGPDAVRSLALDAAQEEVPPLERGLGALATVAQIAPLLGLLGTVVGLMEAFQSARAAERVTTELLSGGIYTALGTTAVGLGVAIPAWIAYSSLAGLSGRLIEMLEFAAKELPVLLEDAAPDGAR